MNTSQNANSGKNPTILLVEDDFLSQELIYGYLGSKFKILVSESVEEAQQQLKQASIDLILLDLALKGDEDGLHLVKYLRKSKKWKSIPVIAITAFAFIADREKSIAAGCNDYLAKPITQNDLLAKIKMWLGE